MQWCFRSKIVLVQLWKIQKNNWSQFEMFADNWLPTNKLANRFRKANDVFQKPW
jgi:hypothetical protein